MGTLHYSFSESFINHFKNDTLKQLRIFIEVMYLVIVVIVAVVVVVVVVHCFLCECATCIIFVY